MEVTLASVGFKLGVYAPFSGDVGASWRQDGEQDGQDDGQERQDEPRWANLVRKRPRRIAAEGADRPLKADCAGPLEELFRKEKTKESGRICKRLCKGLDEVIQHAGSPFGDGGFNRFAQSAGPAFIRYWPRR